MKEPEVRRGRRVRPPAAVDEGEAGVAVALPGSARSTRWRRLRWPRSAVEADGGRGEHDHEADDADGGVARLIDAGHQHGDADDEARRRRAIARRRAALRRVVPRRVEANFGSSSTRARSICSSSRSSSSESGTVPPAVGRGRQDHHPRTGCVVKSRQRVGAAVAGIGEFRARSDHDSVSGGVRLGVRRAGWPGGPRPSRTGRVARSTARSASDQPCSRSPRTSCRCTVARGTSPSTRTPTSRIRARCSPRAS